MAGKVASRAERNGDGFLVAAVTKETDVVVYDDEGKSMAVGVVKTHVGIIPHHALVGGFNPADFLPAISAKAGALLLQPSADLQDFSRLHLTAYFRY